MYRRTLHRHFPNIYWNFRHFSDSQNNKWPSKRVRRTFIDYFSSQGCSIVPSSSVIPMDDRSILYVNAGMNQFKPVFLGTLDPKDVRSRLKLATNSQKCIRAGGKHNDLDEVGRDGTHHTFFEMLGNWGFDGHLSKSDACKQALELLVDIYGLEKRRLFVTYFNGNDELGLKADLESRDIWRGLGFPENRILGLGMEDNFWEMSSTGGPCGPCTEILYCNSDPPYDASHCMELWNIVFVSYNKLADGTLSPLARMHVDTGMGLERLCCVLQGVNSTYETDLFQPLLREIQSQSGGPKYGGLFGADDVDGINTCYRILADHSRMLTVALADGVAPASNKAGNILRRVIRSAAYQASLLRSKIPRNRKGKVNLADLSNVVAVTLGDAYPELLSNLDYVREIVGQEQEIFEDLVQKSKQRLGVLLAKANGRLSSADLFQFHQEYGLPHDILMSMARNKGVKIDEEEFQKKVDEYRNTTRIIPENAAFEADVTNVVNQLKANQVVITDDTAKYEIIRQGPSNYFLPPRMANVVGVARSGQLLDDVPVTDECSIIMDTTSFYAEAGGQCGDKGLIKASGGVFEVDKTYARGGYVFHQGRLVNGNMRLGDHVFAVVNQDWRIRCMQHHTATHLVLAALERLLGRVRQRSSKLDNELSKLGFWCSSSIFPELILKLERKVNDIVVSNVPVFTEEAPFDTVKNCPRIRYIHGEFYPDSVRVVTIGSPLKKVLDPEEDDGNSLVSAELCCGTHVQYLNDIGTLRIISVEDGSSGVIKTITFAAGESAQMAELRGKEMSEEITLELEKMKKDGRRDEKLLAELKQKALKAVIPFEMRGRIIREIADIGTGKERRKRAVKTQR